MKRLVAITSMIILSNFWISTAFSASLRDGYYEIKANHSGKCLEVPKSSRDNNIEVIQYTCENIPNQHWKFTKGPTGLYKIQAKHSDKCLDVPRNSRVNGTKIVQNECESSSSQLWKLTKDTTGQYEIRATQSDKCLDVLRSSEGNNAKIIQNSCRNSTNQLWKLSYRKPSIENESVTEEIYLIDVKETPGKILQLFSVNWSRAPVLRPVYTRPSAYIHTIAFHEFGLAYFIDLARHNIYVTDGITEERIFSSRIPIQDLDFDSYGRLYFSMIDDEKGEIYRLNIFSREVTRYAVFSFRNLANQIRGSWNGYFAFDPSDKLYLSLDSPVSSNSSICEYYGGQLWKRFTHNERITGFTFVDEDTIYFTNSDTRLYEVKRFTDIFIKHEVSDDRKLNDVELVKLPKYGVCTLSGRIRGGKALWSITSVRAAGPNVFWRYIPDSSMLISEDGTYDLSNLPDGQYRVSTAIHAETMSRFTPEKRVVDCNSTVQDIDFKYSK